MDDVATATRILLVDDHQLVRDGLRALLEQQPDFRVVGEASNARELYQALETIACDVVLLDVSLPGSSGIAVMRELKRREVRVPILMLSMHAEEDLVAEAMAAGAAGYALKHQPHEDLVNAVRRVAAGGRYISPQLSSSLIDACLGPGAPRPPGTLAALTPREREVFHLLVRGYNNDAVAKELCISVKTVETHRTHVLHKLRVHSLVDLVRLAARHNLLPPDDPGTARRTA